MRPGGVVNVLAAGVIGATAAEGLRSPVPERAPLATIAARAPGPPPPPEVERPAPGLEASLPPDREADARADLAHERVAWLALEGHPAGALAEADRLRELGPWLRPDDVRRLLELAREDPLDARRRAAFVALGHVRPACAAHVDALTAAWLARPTEESRLGLLEALLGLRHAGVPVEAGLEVALVAPAPSERLVTSRREPP